MAQLLSMLTITIIPKYTPMYLTDYLTHQEFRCRCKKNSCHFTLVSPKLLDAYKSLRSSWGSPLVVNSGFRCMVHNSEVDGSSKKSSHTTGLAIDLSPENGDIDKLEAEARKHFDVVIRYKTFIHCHMFGEEL